MTTAWLAQLERLFWPSGFKRDVWMIVDAARDPQIFQFLQECHMKHHCLYSGSLSPALAAAAPYLVEMDYDHRDTRRFLTHAWGNSWGVFLKCGAHHHVLWQHLREFLFVTSPDGKRLLFRYYDPRVFSVYLPTFTQEQLRVFFGPIDRFWVEDIQMGSCRQFTFDPIHLNESHNGYGLSSNDSLPTVLARVVLGALVVSYISIFPNSTKER